MKRFGLPALLALTLCACGGGRSAVTEQVDTGLDESVETTTTTGVVLEGEELPGGVERGPADLPMVIYFDYDESDVKPGDIATVNGHADYLLARPSAVVRLEGNTDERGTREYNIGLGERRAQSVRRMLTVRGVPAQQIQTVSFGEERPAVPGQTEEAWAKNRRVEFVYIQ